MHSLVMVSIPRDNFRLFMFFPCATVATGFPSPCPCSFLKLGLCMVPRCTTYCTHTKLHCTHPASPTHPKRLLPYIAKPLKYISHIHCASQPSPTNCSAIHARPGIVKSACTRSVRALRTQTSSWEPFGPLDGVTHAEKIRN